MPEGAVSSTGVAVVVATSGGVAATRVAGASEGAEAETATTGDVGRFEAGPLDAHAATMGRSKRAVAIGFVLIAE